MADTLFQPNQMLMAQQPQAQLGGLGALNPSSMMPATGGTAQPGMVSDTMQPRAQGSFGPQTPDTSMQAYQMHMALANYAGGMAPTYEQWKSQQENPFGGIKGMGALNPSSMMPATGGTARPPMGNTMPLPPIVVQAPQFDNLGNLIQPGMSRPIDTPGFNPSLRPRPNNSFFKNLPQSVLGFRVPPFMSQPNSPRPGSLQSLFGGPNEPFKPRPSTNLFPGQSAGGPNVDVRPFSGATPMSPQPMQPQVSPRPATPIQGPLARLFGRR